MSTEFFLSITPGLEPLALKELLEKWALMGSSYIALFTAPPNYKIEKGGITLKCSEAEGWLLNAYLKTPTRILQRVATFRARDVPKLYEKTRKLEWTRFFRNGDILISVSAHTSRLSMKEQIEDVIQSALKNYQEHQPLRKPLLNTPQTLFARIADDEMTLSVDTSGEALYQRGYKTQTVEAPLRETLAAAFFLAAKNVSTQTITTVVDPMCGSGTFLCEAIGFYAASRSRLFAFQNFPAFASVLPQYKLFDLESCSFNLIGYDKNESAVLAAQTNLQNLSKKLKMVHLIEKKDLFETLESQMKASLLLLNPPFGRRLEVDGGLSSYYQSLIDKVIQIYSPRTIGILCPSEVRGLMTHGAYEWDKPIVTTTGGLEVKFEILKR